MSLYILDTDHVSLAQRNHPAVLQHLAATAPTDLAVSIITVEEQLRGWLRVIRRAPRGPRLSAGYRALITAVNYYRKMRLLEFDDEASERYEQLLAEKIRIGTHDLRIAATVLSLDGILVTRNQRDFSQVPELRCEDWTTPSSSNPF